MKGHERAGAVLSIAFAACALVACSHGLQKSEPSARVYNYDQAPPSQALHARGGITPEVNFVKMSDGIALRVAKFAPPTGMTPRATLLAVSGTGGTVEDLQGLATLLAQQGILVFGADLRGQGLSGRTDPDPQKINVDPRVHPADMACVIKKLVAPQQAGPLVILGHSMGGAAVVYGLASGTLVPDAAILLAPALGMPGVPLQGTGANVANTMTSLISTWLGINTYLPGQDLLQRPFRDPTPQNLLSRNIPALRERLDNMQREPRLRSYGVTWGWFSDNLRMMQALARLSARSISMPTLLVEPNDERVVDSAQSRRTCATTFTQCTRKTVDGRHGLTAELPTTVKTLAGYIRSFIDSLQPPFAPGAPASLRQAGREGPGGQRGPG